MNDFNTVKKRKSRKLEETEGLFKALSHTVQSAWSKVILGIAVWIRGLKKIVYF